jgi:hypothetical protein
MLRLLAFLSLLGVEEKSLFLSASSDECIDFLFCGYEWQLFYSAVSRWIPSAADHDQEVGVARMPVPKLVCEVSHVSGFVSFTDGDMLGT